MTAVSTPEKENTLLKEELASQKSMFAMATNYMQQLQEKIERARKELEVKNHETQESIRYAALLQSSAIVPEEILKKDFEDIFVFHRQSEVIGGDIYWYKKQNNLKYLAVMDCTGHGIPGAMLTMAAHSLLSALTDNVIEAETSPAKLLARFNRRFMRNYITENSAVRDGADMALCIIDEATNKIWFSGANRPMVRVRNNEPEVFKSTKASIGSADEGVFFDTAIDALPGDSFFIFSDGYADQFGGPDNKKYKTKTLINLLAANAHLPMSTLNELIITTHTNWKGNYPQTDDILITGFKLNTNTN